MLRQLIQKGDYVAYIDVYGGTCNASVYIVADFTPAKVRIISKYRLKEISQGKQFNGKLALSVPKRLIVLNEGVARNVLTNTMTAQEFDLIEEFRQTLINE